jgi:hypothetical protein
VPPIVELPLDSSNDANLESNIVYLDDDNNEKQNCKSEKYFNAR